MQGGGAFWISLSKTSEGLCVYFGCIGIMFYMYIVVILYYTYAYLHLKVLCS